MTFSRNNRSAFLFTFILALTSCLPTKHSLHTGTISKSAIFNGEQYHVNTDSLDGQPYLTIHKDNIELDFGQSTIDGRASNKFPDAYSGIAIHIKNCKNVTIKNLNIHGFKIAILAENVANLNILSSDFSYNCRPKLYSRFDRESLSDWLYYHHNEDDEWKDYGAAIYLKHCSNPFIRDIICHQGMNGLLMVQCDGGLIYNNDIRFNSGLGIGLYRSGHNRIMHNKLDWNARGYSHGQYARGQDSAAILLFEQSSHNTIAYNSATHSGDGLFLWAGQYTMDTGRGGCDINMICHNDFSHSIANGIEVTFSANYMVDNTINDCRYGVWGGYSHHSVIRGNEIKNCETGIAIEHGRYNVIEDNLLADSKTGIQLWARSSQPSDWPYAQAINVDSRQYRIAKNQFININTALEISLTDSVWIEDNKFTKIQHETSSPKGASMFLSGHEKQLWMDPAAELPERMIIGNFTNLSPGALRGRKYIIINAWGPYDFQYPLLALRKKEQTDNNELLHFDVYGPPGVWHIDSIAGCTFPDHLSGQVPDSFVIQCQTDIIHRHVGLSFTGDIIVTQFGDTLPASTAYRFSYSESSLPTDWKISFFAYDSLSDPLFYPMAFQKVLNGKPLKTITSHQLAYRWWDAPDADVPADHFAVKAITSISTPAGEYTLQTESDDGIRVWLDDKMILEHWDVHTPAIDEVKFNATEGYHILIVEYFDAGGLAVLDVAISQQ